MAASVGVGVGVALVESHTLLAECDRLAPIRGRASRVSSLMGSLGLKDLGLAVVAPRMAQQAEITAFHSTEYVDLLQQHDDDGGGGDDDGGGGDDDDDDDECPENGQDFGLGYDCPRLDRLYRLVRVLAGASISGAECLTSGRFRTAINWCGGWHHAQRDQAQGFCYVNDIVLAIHQLKKTFKRVLYVDLDVHHGDGVENAFAFSPNVFTFSMHLFEAGFYPGTGDLYDVGYGKGKYYNLNIPLREGICDDQYVDLFQRSLSSIVSCFRPSALVCQCGSDSLSRDPMGGMNLTPEGLLRGCLDPLLSLGLPTLLLGGGGYVTPTTASYWTRITALAMEKVAWTGQTEETRAQKQLITGKENIPESDPFFLDYGPTYQLDMDFRKGNRMNKNKEEDLERIREVIKAHLSHVNVTES